MKHNLCNEPKSGEISGMLLHQYGNAIKSFATDDTLAEQH